MQIRVMIGGLLLIAMLTGCGQKGPLFIPQDSSPNNEPAPQQSEDKAKPNQPI
jgi:predicted small lipoprotein YifL